MSIIGGRRDLLLDASRDSSRCRIRTEERKTAGAVKDTGMVPTEGPPMPKLGTKSNFIDDVKAQVK
ncbi:unnamed protein product [Prunus armeniaca]